MLMARKSVLKHRELLPKREYHLLTLRQHVLGEMPRISSRHLSLVIKLARILRGKLRGFRHEKHFLAKKSPSVYDRRVPTVPFSLDSRPHTKENFHG